VPKLKQLQATAARCGVTNLQLLSGSEAVALEPSLSAAAALLSPSTGILDSHAYMAALLQDAEGAGAVFAPNSRLLAAQQVPGSTFVPAAASGSSGSGGGSTQATRPLLQLDVQDTGSGAVSRLRTRWVVNAAGLSAQDVARRISPAPAAIPRQHLAKGNYFSLAGKAPFSRLIYPLPGDGGLGVHLTLDLGGAARFGPDVEWLPPPASDGANGSAEAQLDYSVDSARAAAFYPVIRQYYPGLQDGALVPAYSGIRPKLHGPGQPAADFVLQGSAEHGVRGLISLFGIESPGLTSSLAIAGEVVRMMPEA
jgi:L-2-hydroxyglutarate oxidase LhgO